MDLAIALALWLAPPLPPVSLPVLTAQRSGGSNDRSRRFPLRRESGGTRGACAARLLAQLVPADSRLNPGREPILGLIEGDSPEPAPLVMRWPGGESIEPARRGASLRLLRFPGPLGAGLWESFPACEGSVQPLAPPARSLLLSAGAAGDPADTRDRDAQVVLRALWSQCGQSVRTADLLARWDFAHLVERLPARLPVICATPLGAGQPRDDSQLPDFLAPLAAAQGDGSPAVPLASSRFVRLARPGQL